VGDSHAHPLDFPEGDDGDVDASGGGRPGQGGEVGGLFLPHGQVQIDHGPVDEVAGPLQHRLVAPQVVDQAGPHRGGEDGQCGRQSLHRLGEVPSQASQQRIPGQGQVCGGAVVGPHLERRSPGDELVQGLVDRRAGHAGLLGHLIARQRLAGGYQGGIGLGLVPRDTQPLQLFDD
jgi:hypothetical protein